MSFLKLWCPTLVSPNLNNPWVTEYMKKHKIPLSNTNTVAPQAWATLEERSSSQASTSQRALTKVLSNTAMVKNTTLLEEFTYIEDSDEDESDYVGFWESPCDSEPEDDGDSDDNFDFDFE